MKVFMLGGTQDVIATQWPTFTSSFSVAVSSAVDSAATSVGSLNWTMIQVMLSVPVPSDMVMSPFAMPPSISSSIMKLVSPFSFDFFPAESFFTGLSGEVAPKPVLDYLLVARDLVEALGALLARTPCLGPFSLRLRTNFAHYSLV